MDHPYSETLDNTKKVLSDRLLSVDKFIGTSVKRYLISLDDLSMEVNIKTTDNIACKDEIEAYKIINDEKFVGNGEAQCSLKKEIIAYQVDGQIYDNFPENAKNIKITYIDYWTQKDLTLINNIFDLIKSCNIKVLGLYNVPIAYQKAHEQELMNKNHVLIDVHTNQVNIYQFDTTNKITQITNLDFGTNWLNEELELAFNMDSKTLNQFISTFDLNNHLDPSLVLANIHQNEYLNVKQIRLVDFYTIMNQTIDRFFIKITNAIAISNNEYWEINCENHWHNLLQTSINCDTNPVYINNAPLIFNHEPIALMDDCHINSLVWAINAAKYEQQQMNEQICSIDSFVAEEVATHQFAKSLMLKLGIMSTGMWAKLGSAGDDIWQKC